VAIQLLSIPLSYLSFGSHGRERRDANGITVEENSHDFSDELRRKQHDGCPRASSMGMEPVQFSLAKPTARGQVELLQFSL